MPKAPTSYTVLRPIGWWGLATLKKAYHFQIDLPTLKYAEISIVIDKKPPRL